MTSPATNLQQKYALAASHQQAGRLREAEALCQQILAQDPNHADSLHLLGLIAHQSGHHAEAIGLIQRAIRLNPSAAIYFTSAGLVHRALGQSAAELAAFQQAAALAPQVPEAHYNVGAALDEQRRRAEAIGAYRRAIALRRDFAEAHNNLGNALRAQGQLAEAIAECRRATELRLNFAEAFNNLGSALQEDDQLDEAIAAFEQAIRLRPDYSEAFNNLGNTLRLAGRLQEAVAALRRALALRPDFPDATWNLSLVLLLLDHTQEGWDAYEARRRLRLRFIHYDFAQPEWDGGEVAGKRILLHAEQGFGDTIQMSRYAALLARRGATVYLECQAELKNLMRGVAGVEQVVGRGETLPDFDLHCPIMSLPGRFRTTLATIPAEVPYISVDPGKLDEWRHRIVKENGVLNVGLTWAGRPNPRNRSIPPELLGPLADVPNVRFYSLQIPDPANPSVLPRGLNAVDCSPHIRDFTDTAAALCNLDLLISIDTATAHLAGALGRPAWVFLQYAADWRWLVDRSDSPWYATLRLFRQPRPGDWKTPIARVAEALAREASTLSKV
ncbi:MAG TPA: tetratricopeptide repeat protein [Humisphaera sp.]|jgi:tetratricopeptide (TPR) repeat protein|nr:tetratricopeptide repeat protein [Humisphaera sp.]